MLLSGGGLACIIYVAPKYNASMILLTIFVTTMELMFYLLTALTNPGIIPVNKQREDFENPPQK